MIGELRVQVFLLALKKACTDPRSVYLVPRPKNTQDMLRLNLSVSDIQAVCRSLTPSDLLAGPCRDDDGSSEDVWIFRKNHRGVPLYVKLKLVSGRVKVLSFHEESPP